MGQNIAAQRCQQRKGRQEFHRCQEPQPIARPRAVVAEKQSEGAQQRCDQSGLPEMVQDGGGHDLPSSFSCAASSCRCCSARCTSARVSFPASTKCAMIGCTRPPNNARKSSINRP